MNIFKRARFEIIYFLGGVPREHINTFNYKNIGSVISQIREGMDKTRI